MRTIKELFVILKDSKGYFMSYPCSGLCYLTSLLTHWGIITNEENFLLIRYINDHRPKWYSKHFSLFRCNSPFYWKRHQWKPRLKWINAQIKKL